MILAIASSSAVQAVSQQFRFVAPVGTTTVNLAGTFNNWSASDTPMKRGADGRTWTISLNLQPGEYQYKFVINGTEWVPDPKGLNKDDGSGNINTFLTIVPADYSTPAEVGDGIITRSALKHGDAFPYVNWQKSGSGGLLDLELRIRPNDVQSVTIRLSNGNTYAMAKVSEDPIFEFVRGEVPWSGSGSLRYSFEIIDGTKSLFYGPNGLTASSVRNEYSISMASLHTPEPPAWVSRSVIYQIFPDRFADGSRANDPANAPAWASAKGYSDWVGGDLAGVSQKLGYLKSLGISAVYFNPLFKTTSYHGYETEDYLKIDPHFGTNEEFAELTRKLRQDGIRTILDGVFNHTSRSFFAFQKAKADGPKSPYWNWYTFYGYPVKDTGTPNYKAFYGYPSMPKLNHSNPDVIKYLLSVPEYWNAHADIAGWRLDAANEVSNAFWKKFRTKVKGISPSDWIVGENWGNSSAYLNSGLWDSAMNYPFLFAVWDFVGKGGSGKPSVLASKLTEIYNWYPPQVNLNLMNLIDSHDTVRILTECGGNAKLRNIAAALEFAWAGTPTVYYGDELGMAGGKDPDNRNPMEWSLDSASNPALQFYRTLISIRNNSPELQEGTPVILDANDSQGTFAFARTLGESAAFCLVNRSNGVKTISIHVPRSVGSFDAVEPITKSSARLRGGETWTVSLPPVSASIYIPADEASKVTTSIESLAHHLLTSLQGGIRIAN